MGHPTGFKWLAPVSHTAEPTDAPEFTTPSEPNKVKLATCWFIALAIVSVASLVAFYLYGNCVSNAPDSAATGDLVEAELAEPKSHLVWDTKSGKKFPRLSCSDPKVPK